jgi:hypothetical protein
MFTVSGSTGGSLGNVIAGALTEHADTGLYIGLSPQVAEVVALEDHDPAACIAFLPVDPEPPR